MNEEEIINVAFNQLRQIMKQVFYNLLLYPLILVHGVLFAQSPSSKSDFRDSAIRRAISEFTKPGGFRKPGSVMVIYYMDSLYLVAYEPVAVGENKVVRGEFVNDLVVVKMIEDHKPYLYGSKLTVEAEDYLPSRFVEKNGMLFMWRDRNYPTTPQSLAILRKYDLLADDQGGQLLELEKPYKEGKKSFHYYFCRNDFSHFKRVKTTAAVGFYPPPKIKCK